MKWLHTFGTIGAVALAIALPGLQVLIAGHPAIAATVAGVYAILGQFVPHAQTETQTAAQSKPAN